MLYPTWRRGFGPQAPATMQSTVIWLTNRLVSIVPLYWALTLMMVVLAVTSAVTFMTLALAGSVFTGLVFHHVLETPLIAWARRQVGKWRA